MAPERQRRRLFGWAGSVTYGAHGSHGWRPMSSAQLLRLMAQHIIKNRPTGTQVDWMY